MSKFYMLMLYLSLYLCLLNVIYENIINVINEKSARRFRRHFFLNFIMNYMNYQNINVIWNGGP